MTEDNWEERQKLMEATVKSAGFSTSSLEYLSQIFDDTAHKAKILGCVVVCPEENQVQLDLDSNEQVREFWIRFNNFTDFLCLEQPLVTPSKNTDHFHVTMTFPRNLTDIERLAIQSIFGSDKMREMLNLLRYLTTGKTSSCFFESTQKIITEDLKKIEEDFDNFGF